jgi:CheY-like chemotaxis protein
VEIKYSIDPNAGTAMADPTQLHQVLMNLCTNAAHAMRQQSKGVLDIRLEFFVLKEESALFWGNLPPGEYIRLQVADTGHGMDAKTMNRIFDPYFTTKNQGEGTGLGLAVVHGIVTNHGGALHVESEIGKGSVFQIYLPRLSSPKSSKKGRAEQHFRGDERILLVDDESQLVNLGKSTLQHLGYKVTATHSSPEALRIFLACPHDFDLVLTDQTMPDITGIHLAEEILSVRPDMPIVLNTGYSDQVDLETAQQAGICEFLAKPWTAATLSAALRRALEKKKREGKK